MEEPKIEEVRRSIYVIWENLQCPICLDLMSSPVSTKCDHQFCRFCIMKLLDNGKTREASCPVCKAKVTKRSLQESPGFKRLVEGLKGLVQAFEDDTCVGYNNKVSQKLENYGAVERRCKEVQLEEGTTSESRPVKSTADNSQSKGSEDITTPSAEVKEGFARLMDLKDSCAITSDREDLESAAADFQRTSGGKADKNSRKVAGEEDTIPKETEGQISEGGETRPSDPDAILDKRQKKSLEKVSEWLLNISPSAAGKGGSDPSCSSQRESEDCLSDGNTSSSTVEKEKDEDEIRKPKRSGHSLCLEEKVFGVVYKRGRKSVRPQVNSCLEKVKASEISHLSPSSPIKTPTKAAKRSSSKLSPDFIKRPHIELEDGNSGKRVSGTELCEMGEINGKETKGCESSEEKEELKVSPVFEVPLQTTRTHKTKMQGVSQEAGSNLVQMDKVEENAKENNASSDKKCLSNKKRKTVARKRLSKGTKALDLVTVEINDPDPVLKPTKGIPIEADVQIDSYSSSEDPGTPGLKSFRRSERLKLFTEEVQGNRKKALPKRSTKNGQEKNITAPDAVEKVLTPLTMEAKKTVVRNGCVAFVDLSGIEDDKLSVGRNLGQCDQKPCHTETDLPMSNSVVEGLQVTLACSPVLTDHPVSPRKHGSDAVVPLSPGNLTNELTDAEFKQDRIDSELDTEQLLKTFKTTKRRSFCIGSPSNKWLNRGLFNSEKLPNPEVKQSKDKILTTPELVCVADSAELVQQDAESLSLGVENHSVSTDSSNPKGSPKSSRVGCLRKSDALLNISASKSKDSVEQLCLNALENNHSRSVCGSSGMVESNGVKFPVRKQKKQSSAHIVSNEEVGPELVFTASEEEPQNPSGRITEEPHPGLQSTTPGDPSGSADVGACNLDTVSPVWGVNNLSTSSMTPDDLLPPNIVVLASSRSAASSRSEDLPLQLCSQINLLKRRRPQKLESSESEDSGEDDQLPSLAKLLGHTSSHSEDLPLLGQECSKKRSSGEAYLSEVPDRCLSPCSAPEGVPASQVSVDLFGTPEECEGGASGHGFSGDSSQFSSEIIGTQQKLAMQQELRRLQQMMVLVTEALHQKEGGGKPRPPPPSASAVSAGAHPCPTSPCDSRTRASISRPQTPPPGQALVSPTQKRTLDPVCTLPGPLASEVQQDEGNIAAEGDGDEIATATLERREGRARHCSTGMPVGTTGVEHGPRGETCLPPSQPRSDTPRQPTQSRARCGKMLLVASGLSTAELSVVKKFARKMGGSVCAEVTPETTHIIIKTDGKLVCERTLKYFLGIAGRKWVVSFHWVTQCFKQGRLLQEALFEVRGDTANGPDHQGPMRARITDEQKLLMRGFEICFQGSFTNMTSGQMEWMVQLCGAIVVKDPSLFTAECKSNLRFVVVPGDSQTDYKAVQQRAMVVSRAWLLDSVATYTLQNPDDYTV
ncbi:breast cancer type 1 susceptibility protein homolog isoform X2 [Brienomyrus brachyistius]|uniref:breast cancer type 1 susceptibility protein homolog isoform X2 n=1 Tax=Brienomyrus brachyistius TaxID=42636 RepID=UPI0020B318E3|nr:breast cancer type 1 susceptibility protein homolog isoform X2 [Brienomyrus brachyistius]